MDVLPGLIALGAVQGLLSALFAAGLVVAHRTHRFLNLAQAGFGLVAGSAVGVLVAHFRWSFWAAAPVGVVLGALLAVAAERLVFARLATAPRLILMVASLGLAQILGALQTALPLAVGGVPPSYRVPLDVVVRVFPVVLTGAHILTLILAPLTLLVMSVYLRSRIGLGAQAVGQNAERARSLGVPAPFVSMVSFAVIGAAGAMAGILAVPVLGYSLDGTPGVAVLLLALAPAAVAGFRDLELAAISAVALGIGYQMLLWFGGQARIATAMLALVAAVAVALRPPAGDRAQRARNTSSWPAAPPVRPGGLTRRLVVPLVLVAFVVPAAVALLVGPADAQLLATGAALALGALSLAVGWCLAGELSLAAWPAAGTAALLAGVVARGPGGPVLGAAVGLVGGAAVLVLLGLAVRRRGGLTFAVVSLAAGSVLADIAALQPFVDGGPPTVSAAAAAVAALALTVAVTSAVAILRSRRAGHRLVAARDDARRARALGVDPPRSRLIGLGISGAIAGLAGLAYLLAVADPAPGTFAADRSLDLLAMSVVGGLGSFWGAVGGAALLTAARTLLDGSWALLGSGVGMLVVLLFAPGGLAVAADRLRRAGGRHDEGRLVTSAETRLALSRPGVRRQLWSAWLGGGLVWTGVVEAPGYIGAAGGPRGALVPAAILSLALAAGLLGLGARARPHASLLAATGPLLLAGLVIDPFVLSVGLVVASTAGGWSVGAAAGTASLVAGSRAAGAAAGLTLVAAGAGLVLLPLSPLWLGGLVLILTLANVEVGLASGAPAPAHPVWSPSGALAARGLGHAFGALRVIESIDIELRAGELAVLAGGNGSGKSTLLRILGGHIVPERGDLFVGNRSVVGASPEDLARNGVFLVSGSRPVFADLTVRENLRIGSWLAAGDRSRALGSAIERFPELQDLLDQPAGTLSGGEQRLVALAQSLLVRPAVVLADEVTLGLSPEARGRALSVLRTLADDGAAVLVVDHQLSDLVPLADRTLVIENGTLVDAPADSGAARFIRVEP